MDVENWAARCADDGEFRLAARHWTGGLTFEVGNSRLSLVLEDGKPAPAKHRDGFVTYSADEAVWSKILAAVPERFHNDLMANASAGGGITLSGDPLQQAQYFAAAARAVELLRPSAPDAQPLSRDQGASGRIDAPVGRYVHLDIDGFDHRIYFETAGQGIPLLLQHTAGCHGSQWRHLFEETSITDRFQLIAYDLPFHGKSLPPVGKQWWSEKYDLTGERLRSIPIKLAEELGLADPVFMGCSVGGLLALDLAHKHSDVFRAVISVEGALQIPGDVEDLQALWHPQISNDYKARLMEGLISPTSPMCYRKETAYVYASGWPQSFIGDLFYYLNEFDLTSTAGEIDTNRCGVHILSGEYDYSGSVELGQAAHKAIAGSSFQEMKGVGHFPMSENPEAFLRYLMPALDRIAG